jgi:energy-coupling factor transporter ATP-binding protein EcfA2
VNGVPPFGRIEQDAFASQAEGAMRSAGHLAYIEVRLDDLEDQLRAVPLWQPAKVVLAELDWVRREMGRLEAAWGKKLVVAIVGPSGAGKSTLLNALAGRELSPTGFERPTTRQVVAYAAARSDVDDLVAALGTDKIAVELAPPTGGLDPARAGAAQPLAHLVLVDTPDTNTLPENQALLAQLLEWVDVLLAVFPAQNPKLRDNLAFLAPFVERLPPSDGDGRAGERTASVVPVLNMVDRVPLDELQDEILPDFRRELSQAWGREAGRVYLVSAAASAPLIAGAQGRFPRDETPLHGLNEFGELRAWLFEHLNQARQVSDQRFQRAEHLLTLVQRDLEARLAGTAEARAEAESALARLNEQGRRAMGEELRARQRGGGLDLQTELYVTLARRWWGPVGWLVALWALLLRLMRGLSGLVGRGSRTSAADRDLFDGLLMGGEGSFLPALREIHAAHWPPTADVLVQAGFSASVRELNAEADLRARAGEALARCSEVLESQIARWTDYLVVWPVQLLFNLPVLGLLGWIGYETVGGFLGLTDTGGARYLSADYFRHAGIALAVVWLLSFVLLQLVCSLSIRAGLRRALAHACTEALARVLLADMPEQLRRLDEMERFFSDSA